MIAEAERPIVIGGRGATWSGAKGALEALAEESGALLATTLLGKGLFDGTRSRSTSPAPSPQISAANTLPKAIS